ncbi:shikimate kinase [Sinomonas atrocyanea]
MAERTIVLVGPTGAGKSAVGGALARLLGVPFLDSDHVLAAAQGPIPELYRSLGEEAFRRAEASVVASLLAEQNRAVLSLGGGAVLDGGTRRLLGAATVVWLDTDLATVLPRIEGGRPLFGGDVAEAWQRNYDRRRPLYQEVASLRIDARQGTPEALAAEIVEGLPGRR